MKAIVLAIVVVLAIAISAHAEMDVDTDKAWKVTNTKDGSSELVFEPVIIEDMNSHYKWMVATSCDPKAEECASFEFNIDNVKMTKVNSKVARKFLDGELKAF